jgi:hypothetical protein
VIAGGLLAVPLAAEAQQTGKVYRVGHLSGSGRGAIGGWVAAFRGGMTAQGYAEGRSWTFDERYAEGRFERLAPLAQELLALAPDLLLVSTTPANLVAKQATRTVPIVMVLVANPLGSGIVTNLRQPEANVIGVTNIVAELAGKRLEILKEMLPAATRFAGRSTTSGMTKAGTRWLGDGSPHSRSAEEDLAPRADPSEPDTQRSRPAYAPGPGILQGVIPTLQPDPQTVRAEPGPGAPDRRARLD